MMNRTPIILTPVMLALLAMPITSFRPATAPAQQASIQWYTMEEVQQLSKKEPRKVFIDMYTDWCGWCKVMDKNTFTNAEVIQELNNTFYAVKFDAEGKDEVVFRDKAYNFVPQGGRGYHELAAYLMQGKLSYPTTVFLDENLELISPVPGYLPPEKMIPILEYIGDDHYKSTKFQDFLSSRS
jgi:thioredoxin-related protein